MNRTKGSLKLVAVLFFVIAFQNCSEFAPANSLQESILASQSPFYTDEPGPPALILPLNPFAANGGRQDTPFNFDFTNATVAVKITGLDATKTYLANDYISLDQDDAFPDALLAPSASLIRSAQAPEFAHVNTYFHIQRLASALKKQNLFPSSAYQRLHVNPHCDKGESAVNNAYFNPEEDLLCMGHADVGANVAWSSLDADVIVHEFGHSLNHTYSTDDILWSSNEAGSMDEGLADIWAFLQNDNPHIAVWYQAAIYNAIGYQLEKFDGLRDLTTVPSYPDDLVGEIHGDSSLLTTVIYELRRSGASPEALRKLNVRMLSSLQVASRFDDAIRTMRQEAASLGLDMANLNASLQARKLLRKDDVTALTLNATNGIFVIDNHAAPSYQSGGNCNAALDAGESVLLFLNLTNTSANFLGSVGARVESASNDVKVLPGGDFGTYLRFPANANFRDAELANASGDTYNNNLLLASFVLKALPTASGPYNFKLKVVGFNSVDSTPITKEIPFTLNVGTIGTLSADCPGSGEQDVFP